MKSPSFDPPEEPVWHRMIAETAYYLAEKRGFAGEHALDDWLAAEQQVKQMLSRNAVIETTMGSTPKKKPDLPEASPSRFEKFATTQAAGDGVQGDPLKKGQSADEKIGANMADRK